MDSYRVITVDVPESPIASGARGPWQLTMGYCNIWVLGRVNIGCNWCQYKNIYDGQGPSNFATREIAKNLRTQENCEEHVFKSNYTY